MSRKPIFTPVTLLIMLGVMWGSGFALARFAVTHGVSPVGYAFWQTAGPAVLLFLFLVTKKAKLSLLWQHKGYFLLLGLIAIAIPNTNMYFISPHVSAGMLSVVINTSPIFILLLALFFREEKWSLQRVIAIMVLTAGLLLLTLPKSLVLHQSGGFSIWILLALVSPLFFAVSAVLISKLSRPIPVDVQACGMMFSATLWLIPLLIASNGFYFPTGHWLARDNAIIAEIILSSLGYLVFFELLLAAGAVYYSFVSGVVAMMGVIWGMVFFQERFTFVQLLSMVLIVSATTLVAYSQVNKSR